MSLAQRHLLLTFALKNSKVENFSEFNDEMSKVSLDIESTAIYFHQDLKFYPGPRFLARKILKTRDSNARNVVAVIILVEN